MVAELGSMVGKRTRPRIANDITELIGNTPLLKLGRNAEGLDATILLKMESMEVARGRGALGGAAGRCWIDTIMWLIIAQPTIVLLL